MITVKEEMQEGLEVISPEAALRTSTQALCRGHRLLLSGSSA